jgi:transcriptional regulator with XRE-family HTH domain
VPRPRGYTINPTALDDLLVIRTMSRATLARRLDMRVQRIHDIERRGARVSIEVANTIANVLGVYPATLFPELAVVNGQPFTIEAP